MITIILLLILAGITIGQLTQSSLFEKAKKAKNEMINAEREEKETLSEYENLIKESGGNSKDSDELIGVDIKITNPKLAMPSQYKVVEGDINKGIVIKDKEENEWTWVEVPKTIFTKATGEEDYNNIEEDLVTYVADYRSDWAKRYWGDEWYEGCGISDPDEYTKLYKKMLKSVYTNGGFWVSRYEIGDSIATKNNILRTKGMEGKAVSRADQIPYTHVTCREAQELASGMTPDLNKKSSLLFNIQWDLICKHFEENKVLTQDQIKTDSKDWGNYINKELKITSKNAKQMTSSEWIAITGTKPTEEILLTTGASEETNKMNIYDLAGNMHEFSLAYAKYDKNRPSTIRGGDYSNKGDGAPYSNYYYVEFTRADEYLGFRATFY